MTKPKTLEINQPANTEGIIYTSIDALQYEIERLISLENQVFFLKKIVVFAWLIDHIHARIALTINRLNEIKQSLERMEANVQEKN